MLDVQAKEDPDDVFGRWLWEEMVKKDSKESDSEYEASEVHDHPYQRQAGSVGLHPFAKKQCVYVYIYIYHFYYVHVFQLLGLELSLVISGKCTRTL